ncbi:protein ABHD16A [Phthorimaea operculella]|nr:protein ABHD16A [Phthorimaea operculella]
MKMTMQCLFSPRLYTIYHDGQRAGAFYEPQGLEKWGDRIISTAHTIMNITLYTSPFICMYMYRRSFTLEETKSLARLFGGVGCLLAFSFLIRGLGRATNPKYLEFLKALTESGPDPKARLQAIRKYDFDFRAWPVDYAVPSKPQPSIWNHPFKNCANPELPGYQRGILQVLAFAAVHTFGLRLIYPGTLSLVQHLLSSALLQGRSQLVEEFEGKRAKILTSDKNEIDTMFVDKRRETSNGSTLVICSEGNSGFYEIGIMTTPIKAGYSALGWNHPGFAGSTGKPLPLAEQNAIDAVMQYAINQLGFQPEDIVMFGWSIGGYTSAWAAANYPVKGLVLDATFDDLLPLAQNQMPRSWALLVREVVRSHVDLHVAALVTQQGVLATNRGNHLLLRLLEARHPDVVTKNDQLIAPLEKYIEMLDTQRAAIERGQVNEADRLVLQLVSEGSCNVVARSYIEMLDTQRAAIERGQVNEADRLQLVSEVLQCGRSQLHRDAGHAARGDRARPG